MAKNSSPKEYDEDDAVKYIRNYLPTELKYKFSDDDINYVIDIVYDYYDSKGLLDDSAEEGTIIDIDEDEILSFITQNIKKDKNQTTKFTKEEINFLLQGELAYCESIGIFE